jgi:phosphocarrier protein
MGSRQVVIGSSSGLHARPASTFAQAAAAAGVPVTIGRVGETPVDAASVLMVMGLGLRAGEPAVIASPEPTADGALDELAALLATDLDAAA